MLAATDWPGNVRQLFELVKQNVAGDISHSARLAKRNRTDFYKLLARYRLEPNDFKKTMKPRGAIFENAP